MVNPLQPEQAPNANFFYGMGPAYGQAGFVAGQPVMPTGFLFEGVRWFESTNLAEKSLQVTVSDASISNAVTTAAPMIFFSRVSVGSSPPTCPKHPLTQSLMTPILGQVQLTSLQLS